VQNKLSNYLIFSEFFSHVASLRHIRFYVVKCALYIDVCETVGDGALRK